ncbi:hypothetical protein LC593_37145 [Nostoc sp. CHAB 5844]|nr:hypothetical protein [Nostoc sp. CHAB 5844]
MHNCLNLRRGGFRNAIALMSHFGAIALLTPGRSPLALAEPSLSTILVKPPVAPYQKPPQNSQKTADIRCSYNPQHHCESEIWQRRYYLWDGS